MECNGLFRRFLTFGLLLLLSPGLLLAQVPGKKALTHEDYDLWSRISGQVFSNNGEWIAFRITPGDGDGTMTLRSVDRPNPLIGTVDRASQHRFTPDSRFLIVTIDPMQAVVDSLEEADTDSDEMPADSLGVIDLTSAFGAGGAIDTDYFKVDRVQNWKTPADEGAYLAYLLEAETTDPESTAEGEEARAERPARGGRGQSDEEGQDRNKAEGEIMVFRDLHSGQETRFEDVTNYYFTDNGMWLVFTASNEDGTADGVFAVNTSSAQASPILTGEGAYRSVTLADDGDQVAFLTNRDDWEADEPANTLYHAALGGGEARAVATEGTPGMPEGWWVPDNASPSFSDEGSRLFFSTAPRPPEEEDEEIPDDEKVVVDIWNWKDPVIQPTQLVQVNQRRDLNFLAYASTDDYRVVQLATEDIPSVTVGEGRDGPLAVGRTDAWVKYGELSPHFGSFRDVFLLDMATGNAELILEKTAASPSFSTAGKYLIWWDNIELHHMVMDLGTREVRNITSDLPYPVYREDDDRPAPPGAHGAAGWLEDDEAILVYDKYDIWEVDPTGSDAPRNVTEGFGRANDIRLRRQNVGGGGGSEGIDPNEDQLLSAYGYHSKKYGFFRDRIDGNREPAQLLLDDFGFGSPQKAEDADVYVITRSTFEESPDLWITDLDFEDWEKISNANPQQADFNWGTAELMDWVSNDGIPLQGILIKPEDFDPTQKYPMMVYFYEKSSQGLHNYRTPGAGGSVNPTFYVSRGYVFFIPDIPYETGHPGESAIDAVIPGILKIVDQGYVDKDRIGAQGHSWGGYQLAYMVTRSNLFAAVEAGAPVSNMTSAYGGIRWQTGRSRMGQYEGGQSRIGGSLWDETLRYINNSPLFEADKIQTPLLVLHNDNDGAVPWYQGIEFFMALRRLQKPIWLVNYNGEPHGVRKEQNRKDWTIRMQQFFDHYLKDAPPPVWMTDGVPALMKGKELGLGLKRGGGG